MADPGDLEESVEKIRARQWPESGARALGSLSGPRFSARPQSLAVLFRTSPPPSHSEGCLQGVCPVDENLAGQLGIFPEAWVLMSTELPDNVLKGQKSWQTLGASRVSTSLAKCLEPVLNHGDVFVTRG